MGRGLVTGPRFVRYRADIWAEVSDDGTIVTVVVDTDSMAHPLDVLGADGEPVENQERTDAIEAAQAGEWPSGLRAESGDTRPGWLSLSQRVGAPSRLLCSWVFSLALARPFR